MNIIPPPTRSRCNLLLHCGASAVSRSALERTPTPKPTATWTPIPHMELLQRVERTLTANSIEIVNQAHSLTADGQRYFGLLEVCQDKRSDEYSWVLGLRNSHDKTFPAGIVAGMQVFVCDNLSFSGEVKLARKHTRFILRDLPTLAHQAVSSIVTNWQRQDRRVEVYHNSKVTDKTAHDLIVRAHDIGAITTRQIPSVVQEWREPSHEEFKPRTAWSLFNAFTETLKGNLTALPQRCTSLQGLFDSNLGILHSLN